MRRPEQALQQQVCAFLDRAYPALVWFHPANGGARSKVEGAIFKTMGVKPGVPDLVFILPTGQAAFVELKAGKGRLTPAQQDFRDRVTKLGCAWCEARSVEEVADILHRWLQPLGWAAQARIAA